MEALVGFPKREVQTISLIGFAHLLSHVYMLALAPLAPSLIKDLNITAVDWGVVLAVFAIFTGIFQTPMGFLVERIGGRKVLIFGLILNAAAFLLIGAFVSSYWTILILIGLAGVGNSVFHPADYSLLSASIGNHRMGRAFSIHTFVGHIGFILGPILTTFLEPFYGWRGAVMVLGAVGLLAAFLLIVCRVIITEGKLIQKKASVMESLRDLLGSKPVLLFFVFYMLSSLANFGITQFSILALQPMYGLEKVAVIGALTAYQVGALLLVLPGGILADKISRYDTVILCGFGITATGIFLVGTTMFEFWMIIPILCLAGAVRGGVNATRDVAVRHVAAALPVGTIFGFVTTGFLVGQAIGGVIYGYLFDNYLPNVIFYASSIFFVLAMFSILFNSGTRKPVSVKE